MTEFSIHSKKHKIFATVLFLVDKSLCQGQFLTNMYSCYLSLIILTTESVTLCLSLSSIAYPPPTRRHSSSALLDSSTADDEIPTLDWLTDSLADKERNGVQLHEGVKDMADDSPFVEEFDADAGLGEAPLPSTGVSVADEMQRTQVDYFFTEIVPVIKGLDEGIKVAQLVTSATRGSFEPVRYLVGLSKSKIPSKKTKTNQAPSTLNDFVMVDVPPFSEQLKQDIQQYLQDNHGRLAAILVTSRDCIHYNDAPGVFSIRRADLDKWTKAYPGMNVVAYRLDVPRDCRELIAQRLDGYGPFAIDDCRSDGNVRNFTFIESGRPLTYDEWDQDVSDDIFAGKRTPPDDSTQDNDPDATLGEGEDDPYSLEAIRAREEGKSILAVYTPGRTYGSVSYVFPNIKLCASGFTIPVEDSRNEENYGMDGTGPALDCRGYITTSRTGISRQMESARNLIQNYMDRITVLLPSRGDPIFLDGTTQQRQSVLLDVVKQYEKIGKIYEQLGIVDRDGDDSIDI